LPTVKAECEQVARQCADENVDYLGFLPGRVAEREIEVDCLRAEFCTCHGLLRADGPGTFTRGQFALRDSGRADGPGPISRRGT
jgi:hypothetical protein